MKTMIARVLLLVIVALAVAGVLLLSGSIPVALIAGAAVAALILADDARIRRARRRA